MTNVANKKKYLLFKKEDGRAEGVKPCAFFSSPAGCKNGAACPFSHTIQAKGSTGWLNIRYYSIIIVCFGYGVIIIVT